jgi:hypothetical protein
LERSLGDAPKSGVLNRQRRCAGAQESESCKDGLVIALVAGRESSLQAVLQ